MTMVTELAVTDGLPPPADLPRGECIVTRLEDGALRIDHADPRILISAELLDTIVTTPIGMAGDTIRLSGQRNAWLVPACARPDHDYTGAVLHIDGINQHVVYRI